MRDCEIIEESWIDRKRPGDTRRNLRETGRYREWPGDTRRDREILGETRRYREWPGDTRRDREI